MTEHVRPPPQGIETAAQGLSFRDARDNPKNNPPKVDLQAAQQWPMLSDALRWPQRGLPVFPLQPRSKTPFAGTGGCKDATRDELQIHEWWRRCPHANIGVATGCGFFVVDLDGEDAQNWFVNACGRNGDPDPTLIVRTARGWHLFYWAPIDIPNSASRLAPHVDVRGTGGYVVAAPSIHPSGVRYVVTTDLPIATAPRWLADLALPDEEPPRELHRCGPLADAQRMRGVAGIVTLVANARPGERNALLFWAGCRFAEMIDAGILGQAYARSLLYRAARSAGLPDREIAATLASALAGGRR